MQSEINTNAESSGEKLYDLCMIQHLCRGNQEQVTKMMKLFIEQTPQAMEEIKEAYKKNDLAIIKKVAHHIKPVFGYYAIIKIEKDIQSIEVIAGQGIATIELELKIKKVDDVVTRVIEQMKNTFQC